MNDKDDFDIKRYIWLIPLVIIIIVATIILVKCTAEDNLKGYTGKDDTSVIDDESSEDDSSSNISSEADSSTTEEFDNTFGDSDKGIHVDCIPASWKRVNGQGITTFIDQQTGSQLLCSIIDYDPRINLITKEYLEQQATAANTKLIEFDNTYTLKNIDTFVDAAAQPSCRRYMAAYNDGKIAQIDIYIWNFDDILSLSFRFDAKYYNDIKMKETVQKIVNSISFIGSYKDGKRGMIPPKVILGYIESVDLEYAYPEGFTYGETGNTIVATSPDKDVSITVIVNESTNPISSVSQMDYAKYIQTLRPTNFVPHYDDFVYQADQMSLRFSYQFEINGATWKGQSYTIRNGRFEYTILYENSIPYTTKCASFTEIFKCFRTNSNYFQQQEQQNQQQNQQGQQQIQSMPQQQIPQQQIQQQGQQQEQQTGTQQNTQQVQQR